MTTMKDRIEALKLVQHVNAGHMNEALKIIDQQQAEISQQSRVITEWERDMKGTLATLEKVKTEKAATPELLVALKASQRLLNSLPPTKQVDDWLAANGGFTVSQNNRDAIAKATGKDST